MLNNEIKDSVLYKELLPFADGLNVSIVDASAVNVKGGGVHVSVVINVKDADTGIDDCEKFHRSVQSMLELKYGRENLSMEVSTPGLQRAFRDVWEFSVFKGKNVRLYSSEYSSWVLGLIVDCNDNSVTLDNAVIEDGLKEIGHVDIDYKYVQKAKLEFVFASKEKK